MKKMIKFFALAAIAALACVSCNKEIEVAVTPENEGINVTLRAEPITKTYIEGTTPKWKATDAIGVFTGADTQNHKFTNTSASGEDAVFNGSVTSAGTYYAYYPYSTSGVNVEKGGADFKFPETQYPTPTSFDGAADLLLSESFSIDSTDPEDISVRFRRLGAFLKFTFTDGTGGKLSGEHAAKVSVIVNNADDSKRPCPRVYVTPSGIGEVGAGMKTINAIYDDGVYELTASGKATWFGILPQTFTTGSTFAITIDTGKYTISRTITLESDVTVGAGDILPIKVTLVNGNVTDKKVQRVWTLKSTSSASWITTLTDGVNYGTNGADFTIAVDNNNVYVPEFGSTKRIWAISNSDKSSVSLVNNTGIESSGFDGSIFLSCARVVQKGDGTPVLIATNLFNNDAGKLYVWDNGIANAPRVVTLTQYEAGRRLGDTFSTYGNYEDCWLIFASQTGNGFVTFKVPTSGTSAGLVSRMAIDLANFASYYPFPGEFNRGMYSRREGYGDEYGWYRNMLLTVAATESELKTGGAHTATPSNLSAWMANYENNNGIGFNYTVYKGRRYVIWCMNHREADTFDLIVKDGSTETDWADIINTTGTVYRESITGGKSTNWKKGADCQIFNTGDEVYIVINKPNVGIALYRLVTE